MKDHVDIECRHDARRNRMPSHRHVAMGFVMSAFGCSASEPAQIPHPGNDPIPSLSASAMQPTAAATAVTSSAPIEPLPRVSGPLHLAASGPGPHLSWIMNVAGGPLLVTGNRNALLGWDSAAGAFVDRSDLSNGIDLENGGDIVGRMDGDLWFVKRTADDKAELYRRAPGKTWQRIASLDGHADIEPFVADSILAKVSAHNGATHFEVFGDAPLPITPQFASSSSPCRLDLQNGGFAAFADGSVVLGSECFAVWSPKTKKATVTMGWGGAVVAIDRESATSAIAFGETRVNLPVIAHGNGTQWSPVDTSKLGKMRIRNAGRTTDGTEWVIGEREGEEPRLFRLPPHATDWDRVVIGMGTSDPKEDEHTSVSMLTIVDGELWIRAEHTVKIEGPYTYAIYTTRSTKKVLTTP